MTSVAELVGELLGPDGRGRPIRARPATASQSHQPEEGDRWFRGARPALENVASGERRRRGPDQTEAGRCRHAQEAQGLCEAWNAQEEALVLSASRVRPDACRWR